MSLALPETNRLALPPIKAEQTARALRRTPLVPDAQHDPLAPCRARGSGSR